MRTITASPWTCSAPASPCGSACCGAEPWPSSAFRRARSSSTALALESSCSWRSMSSWPAVRRELVVERARGLELVHRVGAGAHVLGLVDRALHGHADVGHLLADAGRRLGDLHGGLGGGVLRLDDLLLGAELVDLAAELLLLVDEVLLLCLELLDLDVEPLQLGLRELLALERDTGEVLAVLREGLTGLRVELDDLLLELLLLQLQTLLGGDDVRDALLDVLQQLHLLLVAVLERLSRILCSIEHPVDLGFDYRGEPPGHPGHGTSLRVVGLRWASD